jgi:hypothetical protein
MVKFACAGCKEHESTSQEHSHYVRSNTNEKKNEHVTLALAQLTKAGDDERRKDDDVSQRSNKL